MLVENQSYRKYEPAKIHGSDFQESCISAGNGPFTNEGCIPDPVNGAKFVRDLYDMAGDAVGDELLTVNDMIHTSD
jgi:hypothetical protein